MGFKRFWVLCIVRVLALATTLGLATYLAFVAGALVPAAIAGALAGWQAYELMRFVDRTNRELARFFESIHYSDFSQAFTDAGRGGTFAELAEEFERVMDEFRAARAETEAHARYLQTVVRHVGIGLICFRQDGSVDLINSAAKRLLGVASIQHVRDLERVSPELAGRIARLRSGDRTLVKVVSNDELLQLTVYATEFKLHADLHKLISLHDIQSELEEQEIEAWQKLTRVLTHEIMNSITPIGSLAGSVHQLLEEVHAAPSGHESTDGAVLDDVREAVRTIERRSQSLLTFVEAYRSLTRVPRPDFQIVTVADLFEDVARLMSDEIERRGARFEWSVDPPDLKLTADPRLTERVLINLLKNAVDAVEGVPGGDVRLSARVDGRGRVVVGVADNGHGIVAEAIDKVFIPFYTTKKEGSGIGLSLSREIMRQHGGSIGVRSTSDRTVFTLRF